MKLPSLMGRELLLWGGSDGREAGTEGRTNDES